MQAAHIDLRQRLLKCRFRAAPNLEEQVVLWPAGPFGRTTFHEIAIARVKLYRLSDISAKVREAAAKL